MDLTLRALNCRRRVGKILMCSNVRFSDSRLTGGQKSRDRANGHLIWASGRENGKEDRSERYLGISKDKEVIEENFEYSTSNN